MRPSAVIPARLAAVEKADDARTALRARPACILNSKSSGRTDAEDTWTAFSNMQTDSARITSRHAEEVPDAPARASDFALVFGHARVIRTGVRLRQPGTRIRDVFQARFRGSAAASRHR